MNLRSYKASKTEVEVELNRLNNVNSSLASENEILSAVNASNENLARIAESISNEKSLTHQIVDMLISRVLVFPGDKVEIEWRVSAFGDVK